MHKNSLKKITFSSAKRRAIEADFEGGEVTSDAGLLLVRESDRRMGLIRSIARRLDDGRQEGKVQHSIETMLRQRVMGLCAGWEDLNDAEQLRQDPVHQLAAGADALASAPTLCRFENRQSREAAWAVTTELVEQFIASHKRPPPYLILDFDATDTPLHGKQEGRFFHGYYDCYCFLPLYVFCGDQLLVAYLRRSNIDAARHAAAILKLLVKRLREAWPRTKIVFRADSGFCRDWLLSWCDRHDVKLDTAEPSLGASLPSWPRCRSRQSVYNASLDVDTDARCSWACEKARAYRSRSPTTLLKTRLRPAGFSCRRGGV